MYCPKNTGNSVRSVLNTRPAGPQCARRGKAETFSQVLRDLPVPLSRRHRPLSGQPECRQQGPNAQQDFALGGIGKGLDGDPGSIVDSDAHRDESASVELGAHAPCMDGFRPGPDILMAPTDASPCTPSRQNAETHALVERLVTQLRVGNQHDGATTVLMKLRTPTGGEIDVRIDNVGDRVNVTLEGSANGSTVQNDLAQRVREQLERQGFAVGDIVCT